MNTRITSERPTHNTVSPRNEILPENYPSHQLEPVAGGCGRSAQAWASADQWLGEGGARYTLRMQTRSDDKWHTMTTSNNLSKLMVYVVALVQNTNISNAFIIDDATGEIIEPRGAV